MHQRKVIVEASFVNQQTSQTKSFDTHLFHENSQRNVDYAECEHLGTLLFSSYTNSF